MSATRNVIVRGKRRVFDDFFKIDELTVSHWRRDGSMSPDRRVLVFERGDSVAALIFNRDTLQVVLVDQFKGPTLEKSQSNGWIVETMAGMIRTGETPQRAVIRETKEETGYKIADPQLITTFYSSPGGTSERIFLYYAEVENADRVAAGGGVRAEGEDIELVTMPVAELFERLRDGKLEDPKLIIAAYWLKDRLGAAPVKKSALTSGAHTFAVRNSNPRLVIGYKTGDILKVRGVDVWVNSENTDMMMDRWIGKTISASIRYGGAEKEGDTIVEDTIANALRDKLRGRRHVRLGAVVDTEPGALRENGVKRIFHVATIEGGVGGRGMHANPGKIVECATKVLEAAHKKNGGFKLWGNRYASILIPLLGSGDGGLPAGQVAEKIVEAALDFYAAHPSTELREIYLLAYAAPDREACEAALIARRDEIERVS